ncbi:trypsin-1-like isoform X2 [Centruroides vittatus]|uniref:trypsin-1-like isoform X2 n=1 Tax=Centruroides vittatus TaxID=120091 RepID=UPI00350ED513
MEFFFRGFNRNLQIFIFLAILCYNVNAEDNGNERGIARRMIGGEEVEIRNFPFMMALFFKGDSIQDYGLFSGTFTLITSKTALGCAHILFKKKPEHFYGTVGHKDKFLGKKVHFEKLIPHQHFDGTLFLFDIGLLILNSAISLSSSPSVSPYVQTIALPRTNIEFYSGTAVMAGWGNTGKKWNDTTRYLKAASVNIVNASDTIYKDNPYYLTESTILTQKDGVSMMPGDSGAPLIYQESDGRRVQIGVLSTSQWISGGINVFVSTSFFLDFIKENCEGKITFV